VLLLSDRPREDTKTLEQIEVGLGSVLIGRRRGGVGVHLR
jgi:hypothetical protein